MPLIRKPHPEAVEVIEARTDRSKLFRLPNGQQKIIARIGRVHFRDDDGKLEDIETDVEVDQAAGEFVSEKMPFRFRVHRKGIGYTYHSRQGGRIRIELESIGGTQFDQDKFYEATRIGNTITFANVAVDLDIVFQVWRGGIRTLRVLKSPLAEKTWQWSVNGDAEGLAKIGAQIGGHDNNQRELGGLSLSNGAATGPENNQSYVCTEMWDGAVVDVDLETRRKSVAFDPQYPVTIDPDVTENIGVTGDDGTSFRGGGGHFDNTHCSVVGHTGVYIQDCGFRFLTVAVNFGASISLAELKLNVSSVASNRDGAGIVYGRLSNNAGAWGPYNKPGVVARTVASTAFPAAGPSGIVAIDVTAQVQEIVNISGWASGNNMALLIRSQDDLNTENTSFEDYLSAGTDEAQLEITLGAAPSGHPASKRMGGVAFASPSGHQYKSGQMRW